jgi:hypothetical protein
MKRLAQTMVLLVVAAVPAYALGGTPGPVVTPEPATIGLVATGAGVLGIAAWLRNRRK